MRLFSCASLVCLLFTAAYFSSAHAGEIDAKVANDDSPSVQTPISPTFSSEQRWNIKRQVMSKRGVMLDMSNMTDNGYAWSNDVVWMGTGGPVNEEWYIAGFLFQKPGYKAVWLQYAFTLDSPTENIRNFKRWYGVGTFR